MELNIRFWFYHLFIISLGFLTCNANIETLFINEMRCSGMYGSDQFPNSKFNASIQLNTKVNDFNHLDGYDYYLLMAFMDFKDFDKLGVPSGSDYVGEKKYICDEEAIGLGFCSKDDSGSYIVLNPDQKNITLQTSKVSLNNENNFMVNGEYKVNSTGYLCVTADLIAVFKNGTVDDKFKFNGYKSQLIWINPYGKLPASEYPKLKFYGLLSIIYLIIGLIWMFLSFKYWNDILPIQNHITFVLLFLIVEMSLNYVYLDNFNQNGVSNYSLLVLVVLLDAGRNSLCFFILLIVSLGYGVVKPNLGNTMKRVQLLTLIHFLCGSLYGSGSMLSNPERIGVKIFIYVLPLSITMTIFYVWIMQAMAQTIDLLQQKHQPTKLKMYQYLRYSIGLSIALLLAYFVLNGLFINKSDDNEFINDQWQSRWFLVDGWLCLLFFSIFLSILILWRPTDNNQRLGLMELAMDEETADALDLENINNQNINNNINNQNNNNNHPITSPIKPSDGEVNIFDIGNDDDDDEFKQTQQQQQQQHQPPPY